MTSQVMQTDGRMLKQTDWTKNVTYFEMFLFDGTDKNSS